MKPSGTATDIATLNLAGLVTFEATVNRFDVGRSTNAVGTFQNSARPQATLTLASSNTITANTLVVGSNAQTTTSNILNLGASNELNVNHWVLAVGRANGTVQFTSGLSQPTLVLRGQAGGQQSCRHHAWRLQKHFGHWCRWRVEHSDWHHELVGGCR